MGKECGVCPAQPCEPIPCSLGPMDEPLEFAARPANDIEIDPFQSWTQLRPVEVAVVADPAADDGIIDLGQILQGFIAAEMKPPTPDFPTDARQRLGAGCGQEAVDCLPLPHRFPGAKLKAQEVERDGGKVAAPVRILAVDPMKRDGTESCPLSKIIELINTGAPPMTM